MIENEYIQRINQAVDFIHKNLDRNLTVEEIADFCCFSRFYFSRMFKAVVGESVYSFIKRKKLENGAFLLRTRTNLTVTDIALQNGYTSSNFASAFKEFFGVSATEYRRSRDNTEKEPHSSIVKHIQELKKREDVFELINAKMQIRRFDRMNLLYDRFIGNYSDLSDFWEKFCTAAEEKKLLNEHTRFIGVSYDDPLVTDENRCFYDVCINVENPVGSNIHKIDEGYYACYQFHDKLINLGKSYNEIFSCWIPFSPYAIDNKLSLEIYHTAVDENSNIKMEICIPIIK